MNQPTGATIVEIAQKRSEKHPDRNYITFLLDGDDQEDFLSYGQLDTSARHVAAWIKNQGLEKKDRALIILPNSMEFVKIFYGCLYGGILAVPLSEPAGPHQMQSYLKTFVPTLKSSKPKLLITTALLVDFLNTQLPPELSSIFTDIKIVSDQDILNADPQHSDLPDLSPEDIAYLQFTSGSTGMPKGIMIGHSNILANMEQAVIFCHWEEKKGTALWLPLFHDFGLAAGLIGALYMGGFAVLTTPVHFILKPVRWLRMISKYQCSYSYAPPFAYDICVKKVSDEEKQQLNLSSLVCSVFGAEPVQYSAVKNFNEKFASCGLKPNAIRPGFGMAETVILFSVSKKLESLCVDRQFLETEGVVKLIDENSSENQIKHLVNLGTNMSGHEIVIKNEQNLALPDGVVGEIVISGPSVCPGYYENPEATRETFQQMIQGKDQPFLSTGDLGILWEKNLYFTGRIKDLIIIHGRNYYPQDIEYALAQISELRAGCIVAYSTESEEGEQLVLAMEVRKDLLKDMDILQNYILPTIDWKITELIGQQFQIYPAVRHYLQPGVIIKTSSGKIKHVANVKRFKKGNIEGLLATLPKEPVQSVGENNIRATVQQLFKKIVEQEPVMDLPFLDLGGDSIKTIEFIEILQQKYPVPDQDIMDNIDETTTLNDIATWFQERI